MADYWDDMANGMRQAGEGLQQAAEGLQQAIGGWVAASDAIRRGRDEYGDLRESVAELQRIVLQQSAEIRELRDRLNGGRP